jgi:hypothetical protein
LYWILGIIIQAQPEADGKPPQSPKRRYGAAARAYPAKMREQANQTQTPTTTADIRMSLNFTVPRPCVVKAFRKSLGPRLMPTRIPLMPVRKLSQVRISYASFLRLQPELHKPRM